MDLLIAAVAGALCWKIIEKLWIWWFYAPRFNDYSELHMRDMHRQQEIKLKAERTVAKVINAVAGFRERSGHPPKRLMLNPANDTLLPFIVANCARHGDEPLMWLGMLVVFDHHLDIPDWRIS